jgi:hypothetical protein
VWDKFPEDFSPGSEITRKIPGSPPRKVVVSRARQAAPDSVIPETPQALSGTQGSEHDLDM